ncbi:FkbM family methyltransferase [Marinobacter sp. 71-i]|uniref:FkbM family methyltransferase n=1 Tax=Marinobacter iranensis TaxID=2962607 RepID=A0ABT5Y9F2_9GAMM|nr:FkbM family methyltransferase [Marinobacter iranensis]MDF0750293.1 FkbM family methyltransferase [Marinobacter iranensis]
MRRAIVSAIRRSPRLYDAINSRRSTHGKLGNWLGSLSAHGPIRFIQVGASDGLRWDPLRKHIINNRWEGALVEPLPPVFELLKRNYAYLSGRQKLAFVNAALSDASGNNLTFWACSRAFLKDLSIDQALYWLRMSSLQREFIERKLRTIAKHSAPESVVEPVEAPVITLSDVIEQHLSGKAPDLLFIDAEGHDDAVIYGHDFKAGKPRWIVYESNGIGAERSLALHSFLVGYGYSVEQLDSDTVATLPN